MVRQINRGHRKNKRKERKRDGRWEWESKVRKLWPKLD